MSFLGECHAVRVVVQPGVGGRAQRPYQIRGSTAVSGADLQHLFAAEIRLGRRAVVKLDGVPVGLILRGQRLSQRRLIKGYQYLFMAIFNPGKGSTALMYRLRVLVTAASMPGASCAAVVDDRKST